METGIVSQVYNKLAAKFSFRRETNLYVKAVSSACELYRVLALFNSARWAFRGQCDSTWLVNSSAQREWKQLSNGDNNAYLDFLEFILREMRKSVTSILSINDFRDHHLFGFLQHHGICTPFVDFSNSRRVALYFATKSSSAPYAAIYIIDRKQAFDNEIVDFDKWLEEKKNEYSGMSDLEQPKFCLWKNTSFLFDMKDNSWPKQLTQGRMENQTGLFLYFRDASNDLEKLYNQFHVIPSAEFRNAKTLHPVVKISIPRTIARWVHWRLVLSGTNQKTLGLNDMQTESRLKVEFEKRIAEFFTQQSRTSTNHLNP